MATAVRQVQLLLDRSNPVPLHHQLSAELRRLIRDGVVPPGEALPSIPTLCEDYGLSTSTISHAMTDLKREGLVVGRRGAGVFVAQSFVPVTELLVCVGYPVGVPTAGSFFYSIIAGMKRGFGRSSRRCILTQYDERPPTAQELGDLLRIRRADSAAGYRPRGEIGEALRELARSYPVVSLLCGLPGSGADSVVSVPGAALRRVLEERIASGKRSFAYVGKELLQRAFVDSPYADMRQCFETVTHEAGVVARVHLDEKVSDTSEPGEDARIAESAGGMPAGTVVVADSPHLAMHLHRRNPTLDLISYTESAATIDECGGHTTLLYTNLESVGEAASRLLADRLSHRVREPKTTRLEPLVLPRGVRPGGRASEPVA